jgi:hypothetical protein
MPEKRVLVKDPNQESTEQRDGAVRVLANDPESCILE